jgi:AcrR family transcriptional regulator
VYEHFGGKEGLYAVVVDREMSFLLGSITESLAIDDDVHPRALLERAGMALFDYIDRYPDGFRILMRDTPSESGSKMPFGGVIVDVAARVEYLLARQFKHYGVSPKWAPLYSQMLVGMVTQTGQWWLDVRKPRKDEVVAHLVNLAWGGLQHLDPKPKLDSR